MIKKSMKKCKTKTYKTTKIKLKKMKKGVDFPKLECYYKQAVTETTAKLQIRHHRRNQKL